MANIHSMMMNSELYYFDAKIAESSKYLDALKKAAEQEVLPKRKNWFASVIGHMTDMREVLIHCKNKLQINAEEPKSSVPPAAPSFPVNSKSQATSLPPLASRDLRFGTQASNVRSNGTTTAPSTSLAATPVTDDVLAERALENQESIVFMNFPESAAVNTTQKINYDLGDVRLILEFLGVAADVQSTCRFSPKNLPSDRPPFLKARFSSEEEKKNVLNAVKSNIHSIRSLGAKFGEINVCDPDKSGAGTNNYRANANSAGASFSSFKSNSQNAFPPFSSRNFGHSNTASTSSSLLPLNDSAALPNTSPSTSSSHVRSNGFGSSNPCASSSNITYPSSFGNRFSSNRDNNLFGSNRTPQSNNAPAAVLQPCTSETDLRRSNMGNGNARSLAKQMFSSTQKRRSKSVQTTRSKTDQASRSNGYTRGLPEDKYTTEEEN